MFSEGKTRTYQEIEELIQSVEEFYLSIYEKSTSVLDIIKSSSEKLKCFNSKKQCIYGSSALCPVQLFHKVWETGASKIYYPEKQLFAFEGIKRRMKQFLTQFKISKKNIKQSEKQISKLNISLVSLKKLTKNYNTPIIYYNDIERAKDKKALGEKFNEYLSNRKLLISQNEERQKSLNKLKQLYEWVNGQIEDFLAKIVKIFDRLGEGIIVVIRQFFYYTIDWTVKQMQKIDKIKLSQKQTKLNFKVDKTGSTDVAYQKSILESKSLIKNKTQEHKLSSTGFIEIRMTIEALNSLKKYLEKQMFQIGHLKQKIFPVCPDVNFFSFYKSSINSLIQTYDSYTESLKGILDYYPSLQKLDLLKLSSIQTMKKIHNKQLSKQNVEQLKISLEKQMVNFQELQQQSNKIFSEILTFSTNKLYEEIRKIDLSLSSNFKEIQNKQEIISTFKIQREEYKSAIDVDVDFQKQISVIIDEAFANVELDKQNPIKVYSCALDGKILLSGKVKLYSQGIAFQSVFNQKNLFFGTTCLTITKTEIVQVEKFQNNIEIITKKGPIILTSLFNRDKIFDQINSILSGKKLNRTNSFEEMSLQSNIFSPPESILDNTQLECVRKKSSNYDKKLEESRSILMFEMNLKGFTLREIFNEFFKQNRLVSYKNKEYKNFKELILLNNHNRQVIIDPLTPKPPNFFDPLSSSKLSEVMNSQRTIKYKHSVESVPIPFMPKFGECTQKETFYWISDKMFIVDSQVYTTGIPFSDSIIAKTRTIVQEGSEGVRINQSAEIQITKSVSFQKIIRSSSEKELKKSGAFMKSQLEILQQNKLRSRINRKQDIPITPSKDQKYQLMVEQFNEKLEKLKSQNQKNILALGFIFLLALFISRSI